MCKFLLLKSLLKTDKKFIFGLPNLPLNLFSDSLEPFGQEYDPYSIKSSDLATAEGQERYRGQQKFARGGNKCGEQNKLMCVQEIMTLNTKFCTIKETYN